MLEAWRGARAEAWSYTVGHGVFVLALHRPPRVAYIQFKDCQSIQLRRTSWGPSDLVVSRDIRDLGTVNTFTDSVNFHLVCWAAFGAESDHLIFPAFFDIDQRA